MQDKQVASRRNEQEEEAPKKLLNDQHYSSVWDNARKFIREI